MDVSDSLQVIYIIGNLYGPIVSLIVITIVLQYRRIFVPTRRSSPVFYWLIQYLTWSTVVICVTGTFIGILTCTPVQRNWDPFVEGNCMDQDRIFIAISMLRVFSEVLTLICPLPTIWRLRMGRQRKMAISALFGVGAM